MFNDLVIGPLLGVTAPGDKMLHWKDMQQYGLIPLMEDKKTLFKDSIMNFPEQFRNKLTSVIITISYNKPYTA